MATMLTSTSTSTSNANLSSHTFSLFETRNNLREASFSSYLNRTEEQIIRKLTESTRTKTPLIFSPPYDDDHHYIGRTKNAKKDGEIGVFSAEKYFKGEIEEESEESSRVFDKQFCTQNYSVKQRSDHEPRTPSIRSESSWNSRSGLLPVIPKTQARKKMNNKVKNGKSFLASLGCSCSDRKSTEIDEKNGADGNRFPGKEIVKPRSDLLSSLNNREDCFSFPVLNSRVGNGNLGVKVHQFQEERENYSTGRNSLDVFGSHVMEMEKEKEKHPSSLGGKLSMLTDWDVIIPREEDIRIPSSGLYNDVESDASSDLFEIESFSTYGNSCLARQISDGMSMSNSSCVTPRNYYAPSEASIEWSVVTASAADFSVASDYEDLRTVKNAKFGKNSGKDNKQKKFPGILSGCKSLKAVRVAGDEYRVMAKKAGAVPPGGRQSDSLPQAETKATGFSTRKDHKYGSDMCTSYSESHSPHASHMLYIQ